MYSLVCHSSDNLSMPRKINLKNLLVNSCPGEVQEPEVEDHQFADALLLLPPLLIKVLQQKDYRSKPRTCSKDCSTSCCIKVIFSLLTSTNQGDDLKPTSLM